MSPSKATYTTVISAQRASAPRWNCSKKAARPRCRCARSHVAPGYRQPPPTATTPIAKRSSQRSRRSAIASLPNGWPPHTPPRQPQEQLTSVAIAYVQFALERPALFRIMFGEPCDRDNDERIAATAAVSLYLREIVGRVFPEADAEAMATANLALVHGLAFLYLDGKLDASTPSAVADRVSAAIHVLLSATSHDRIWRT